MKSVLLLAMLFVAVSLKAAEPVDVWKKECPPIAGRRWDVPFGVANGRLLVLGGRTTWADYKQPRPYDVLAWNAASSTWENEFPDGKEWGPRVGLCQAPAWKDEHWSFRDVEGNVRPNWTVYGTFSLGRKYGFDPDTRKFYFYSLGKTFSYDPATRAWADLNPPTNPEGDLGGILLWSSMCYDQHNKRFVLFGGGNIQSQRGDPGTWTYSPAENVWAQLSLDREPPPRANSRLVYDPGSKKIVLFGGDRLDQLYSDTWTFDCIADKWEEQRPSSGPSPRAGHAFLPFGKGRLLLLGGYGYTSTTDYVGALYRRLPFEAWLYDIEANRWTFRRRWESMECPSGPINTGLNAAILDDSVYVLAEGTWRCRISDKPSEDKSDKFGVPPGTIERRTGSFDPAWYQDVPPADPDRVAGELRDLPTNRWVVRPTPKRPEMNMDWGSAVFAPETDQILRFSGGHSAYSGTAPQIYDVKTDRYSIPFAPELPIEFVYSNDQVHGERSFGGNPWMTGHTYKSTGYDPRLQSLVFAPHATTYFFNSKTKRWKASRQINPYRADFYNVTVCSTPQGAIVWGDKREGGGAGLWRLSDEVVWQPLPLKGELPAKSPDQHGLAFDSKRNRLLFFSGIDKNRGDVTAYDFATGESRRLDAVGKQFAGVPSRETVYLPEADVVLLGARAVVNDKLLWLAYDCERNAWRGIELVGDDPIGKGTAGRAFNNSMGLMYDPNRKLVWAVGQHSHVHVLKFDAARSIALEQP